jgi:hypothetical protein
MRQPHSFEEAPLGKTAKPRAKRGQNHYLISTLPRAEALKMHRLGVAGAFWIALIGALLLAGVLVMRYGWIAGR